MLYDDDPNKETYEIRSIEDDKFLVFVMTVVKISQAMDETNMYDAVNVALELMPNSINSSSKVGSFFLSLVLTIIILAGFLAFIYFFLLPKHIQKSIYGVPK